MKTFKIRAERNVQITRLDEEMFAELYAFENDGRKPTFSELVEYIQEWFDDELDTFVDDLVANFRQTIHEDLAGRYTEGGDDVEL